MQRDCRVIECGQMHCPGKCRLIQGDRRHAQEDMFTKCWMDKVSNIGKLIILEVVISKPGIYLREVREELGQNTGIGINESTIRFSKVDLLDKIKLAPNKEVNY